MTAISTGNCELEVKRKDDGSWHPCQISLSDDNLDIIVQFESCGDKDIISEEKDALARLRYRSVPVGKGGCSEIGEGECVLAVHEGQGVCLFFDAVVMEPRRVKHSKRANCKCLFQIKWLNPEMEKNISSISSSLIRKLSKKSITSHSVIDAFLNSLNPATSANGSPPNSLLDDTIWGLVEKIEETSKCTEKSTEWAGDNFLRAKRGKLSGVALKTVTKGRRPTRNQAKQEVKMDVDKPLEGKPFVSPLAACAALASYIHELSPNRGTLVSQLEKEVPAVSILVKSDTSNTSAVSNPPKRSRLPSSVRSSGKSQSSDSQVSSTRPRRSAQVSNLSNGGLSSPPITEHTTIPLPVADREQNGHTRKSRTTRSAVQEQPIDLTAEVQELSKEKCDNLSNTKRPTRSVAKSKPTESSQAKESEDNLTTETNEVQDLSKEKRDNLRNIKRPTRSVAKSKPTESSQDNLTTETNQVQGLSKEKHGNLRNTKRPTRSVAKSKPAESSQAKESEDNLTTETNEVQDLSKEKRDNLRNTKRPTRSVAESKPTESSQAKESEDNLTTETNEVQESSKEKRDNLRDTKRPRRSVARSKPAESSQAKELEDNLTTETNAVADVKLNDATSRAKRSSATEKIDSSEMTQGSSKKRSARVTHSGKEANGLSVQQEPGKINLTETSLNTSVENDATREKRSKRKSTSLLIVNEEDRGEVIQKAESPAIASKMPEKRSSARLRTR